jgi:hypothetical protein
VPHQLEGIAAGVIAKDWPVWLSVLPALGITDVAAWGPRPDYMTTYFTQECPELHILSTKKMDVVFVLGGAQVCQADLLRSQRPKNLGYLSCVARRATGYPRRDGFALEAGTPRSRGREHQWRVLGGRVNEGGRVGIKASGTA